MYPENSAFLVLLILCLKVISTNSGSTLWKLNSDQTKIIDGTEIHSKVCLFEEGISDKELLDIISSTVFHGETWLKHDKHIIQNNAPKPMDIMQRNESMHSSENVTTKGHINQTNSENKASFEFKPPTKSTSTEDNLFDCGIPVNYTHYDSLVGVFNRYILPNVSNPHSATVFGYHTYSEGDDTIIVDYSDYIRFLTHSIKKARQQKSNSAPLYNFLGNYWQLKGYSHKSIECFRKGLSISPHNARILLNLARLLFYLQYLDDAIYLTKRSLEMEQVNNGVWIHHLTLGEIFKAYGMYQEARVHLSHSLKLKPDLTVARLLLQQINGMQCTDEINSNTMFIIILLAVLVLGCLLIMHNLRIDICKEKHVIRVTDTGVRYFKNLRKNHRFRRLST